MTDSVARIEAAGFARLVPPYGGSVEELPAAFWATFAESLASTPGEDALDGDERLLVEAARDLAYHCGHEVISSWPWAPFVTPLDSPDATSDDVLHTVFATLAALGIERCRLVELVPFDRLVLRVPVTRQPAARIRTSGTFGTSDGRATARSDEFSVRGYCVGIMELAYGGRYDQEGPGDTFRCRRSDAAENADGAEFIVTRASEPA